MRTTAWTGLAVVAGLVAAAAGTAAEFDDPEWPCIQRRVPELTVGQMWSGPPAGEEADDPAVLALAERIAPRRMSLEEVEREAAAFAEERDADSRAEALAALFEAVLARINAERGHVISGIGRYARRQAALAERIEAMQLELQRLEQAPEADRDPDRIEQLREALAWDTRIFRERAQSLVYVCETPVLLEQRAFAIARALAGLL